MHKRILRFFLVLIVLVFALWCKMRWGVWFHNPPEEPYAPLTQPGRVLLTFGEDEQSRLVSWQCDSVLHPSWVELVGPAGDTLRIEAKGEIFASRSGRAAYYIARLDRLSQSGSYAYRVATEGRTSDWYAFRVFPSGPRPISFLFIGDVQDTIQGATNRFLRQALARHPKCELTISGGDLIERPTDAYWAEGFRNIDSLGQFMPLLAVTGNHDYFKGIIPRMERRFDLVFPYFLRAAVRDNRVYTLCYGNVQFFLLDSNRRPHQLWQQRRWLREQLHQSRAQWKILVLHHPLFSIKGNNNLVQRWMFNDLVEEYGVDLVLQGHEHAYARTTRKEKDGTPTTPVYTVSHCSPKNYRIQFDDRFDRFGISSRYYQIVETTDTVLTLSAYNVGDHSLYDSLRIVKNFPSEAQCVRIDDQGRFMPEYMKYTPLPGNKKDSKFKERIEHYCQTHPEKLFVK